MTRTYRGQRRAALFWALSLLVALSMVCGTILVVLPSPQRRPQATPTPTLTSISPSPATKTVEPSPSLATPSPVPAMVPTPVAQPTS